MSYYPIVTSARQYLMRRAVPGALLALGAGGCVEPYMPEVISAPTTYLVVDGFINGSGRTRIKLSRTENIATLTAPPAEKGARIQVVSEAGQHYALTEKAEGLYQSDSLQLPMGRYQLHITTAGGAAANYESDLTPLKITPPIDKLGFKLVDGQVRVVVSTHDETRQSIYYRWSFVETWEFNSAFLSSLEYDYTLKKIVGRTTPIYTCWHTEQSSLIQQGSSAQLSQDALTDVPLLAISTRAERLKVRYSVLVSQYAETAAEFAYYEQLRKNTEAVGTINDPLPTQLTGNVHRVGQPTEPVLGFVGAHTVQRQRLFINRRDLSLPQTWLFDDPYRTCTTSDSLEEDFFSNPGVVPIAYVPAKPLFVGASAECADCRLRGSNVKPSFW